MRLVAFLVLCQALAGQKPPPAEKFVYDATWKLVRAGMVTLEAGKDWAGLKLQSAGLVSSLFRIDDTYSVNFADQYCATTSVLDSMENKRHREARVTFDREQNRAFYVEWDLLTGAAVHNADVEIPDCVSETLGAMLRLRETTVEVGQSVQLPVSDGRRFAMVRIEAQEREQIKTPAGSFRAIRYEAGLLNGVVYSRKGRVFLWLSDDARRTPVQIQLRISFPIGTVTLGLKKEER